MPVEYRVVSGIGFTLEKEEAERILGELIDEIPDLNSSEKEFLAEDNLAEFLDSVERKHFTDLGDGWTCAVEFIGNMYTGENVKIVLLAQHDRMPRPYVDGWEETGFTDWNLVDCARGKMLYLAAKWGIIDSPNQDRVGFISALYVG